VIGAELFCALGWLQEKTTFVYVPTKLIQQASSVFFLFRLQAYCLPKSSLHTQQHMCVYRPNTLYIAHL
jgi:hypothetical protein